MIHFLKITAVFAITLASAGAILACGDEGTDSSSSPAGNDAPVKQRDGNSIKAPGNPASAGVKRPKAPDDVISDRPGGPKDKSGNRSGKQSANTKDDPGSGTSSDPPTVIPEAP